ncbi:MAG: ATP-binding protein [Phycisphaerales bacterium]|nr:ATP-binding protein [Phycisphaerales bacterium]
MAHPQPHRGDRSQGPESGTLLLRNSRTEIDRAYARVLDAMSRHGFQEASAFAVKLSLEEALANAFAHGHKSLPPDEPVRLEFSVDGAGVHLVVEDKGPGFTPTTVPDPTLEENLELPTGRGLLLMRAYMARVEYEGRGNRLVMVYRKP